MNPIRGVTPFPLFDGAEGFEAENGFVLRFTTGDLLALKQIYRPDNKLVYITATAADQIEALTYRVPLWEAVRAGDEEAIVDCLKVGLKRADGKTQAIYAGGTWKDLPFTATEASLFILDALCLAWHRKTVLELHEERQRIAQEALTSQGGDEGATLDDPQMSSSGYTEPPLEQALDQPKSGI